MENAEQEVARQRQLYAQHNTSLRNLQSAEAQLALLRVLAPMSGTVVHVNVKPGQSVDLPTVVAEVMDLNRLVVAAAIPAAQAGELKAGNPVEVLTEPAVTTELALHQPDGGHEQRHGSGAGVVAGGRRFAARTICSFAHRDGGSHELSGRAGEGVVTDESGQSVIALVKGSEATQTAVRAGLRENGWIEVAAPELRAGDALVTVGAYGLPGTTKIRVQNAAGGETSTNSSSAK